MAKYFTFYELVYSSTAEKKGINNTPQEEKLIKNINRLIDFLDLIREKWGSAIKVGSGYRCPQLNEEVGGSTTSVHMLGLAADLTPKNGKTTEFFEFVKTYLIENEIPFDQLIDEHSGKRHWVHIGLENSQGKQRKQIKKYINGKYTIIK